MRRYRFHREVELKRQINSRIPQAKSRVLEIMKPARTPGRDRSPPKPHIKILKANHNSKERSPEDSHGRRYMEEE